MPVTKALWVLIMDRFDKDFHNVDPETSRPFSSGHPDGVWLISIIYSLPFFIPITVIIIAIFLGLIFGGISWSLVGSMAIAVIVNSLLFLPAIILMFRRSAKAIYYTLFLLLLSYIGLLAVYFLKPDVIIAGIVAIVLQAYICYYLYGLKKDLLLK